VDADEAHDWNNRMFEALGLEPVDPLPPGTSGAGSPPSTEVRHRHRVRSLRSPGSSSCCPSGTPTGRYRSGPPADPGIERYDWQVAVAWRLAPRPDDERRYADELRVHERDTEGLSEHDRRMLRHRFLRGISGPPGRALALSDDVGTDYRSAGGGSGGGGDELTGRARFVPVSRRRRPC